MPQDYPEFGTGKLLALLLIERQISSARQWRYEWAVLAWIGIASLVAADALLGTTTDLMTVVGVLCLLLAGMDLNRRERFAFWELLKIYEQIGGRYPLHSSWWRL